MHTTTQQQTKKPGSQLQAIDENLSFIQKENGHSEDQLTGFERESQDMSWHFHFTEEETGKKRLLPGLSHSFDNISLYPTLPSGIQAKLSVNSPGDVYEQEADAVADKIMTMPDSQNLHAGPTASNGISPLPVTSGREEQNEQEEKKEEQEEEKEDPDPQLKIQRKCAECEEEEEEEKGKDLQRKESGGGTPAASTAVNQALRSGGKPLDLPARSFMESRFGFDFSKVRIHDDPQAHQSAKDINALAYTHRNDIVFGAGQYRPRTEAGKKLLAHELTHVLQQGDENTIRRVASIPTSSGAAEGMSMEPGENTSPAQPGNTEEDMSVDANQDMSIDHARFIVEDGTETGEGQMEKSRFLNLLNEKVCRTVDDELRGTQYSSDNCPYIKRAFARHADILPLELEQLIGRYAPATTEAKNAHHLISLMLVRVREAVAQWKKTGDMSAVPDEIRAEIYDSMSVELKTRMKGTAARAKKLFFKSKPGGAHATQSPQDVLQSLGKGQAMENRTRQKMEGAFGTDFSKVKVHTDTHAAGLSDEMNAKAFSVGEHIVFGSGEYEPGTIEGNALMAHELAHVVQQRHTPLKETSELPVNEPAVEEDADRTTISVMRQLLSKTKSRFDVVLPRLRSGLSLTRCTRDPMSQQQIDQLKPILEKNLIIMNGIDPGIVGSRFSYEFAPQGLESVMLSKSFSLKTLVYPSGQKIEWEKDTQTYSAGGYAAISDARPILNQEGAYTFTIDLKVIGDDNSTEAIFTMTRTFNVTSLRKRSDKALADASTQEFTDFKAGLSAQLGLLAPENKPANPTDPHISSSAPNPAPASTAPNFSNLTYQVANSDPALEHHWFIRPVQWDKMPDKVGNYKTVDDNGMKLYDLGTGLSAQWPSIHPNIYVVVCRRFENIGVGAKRALPDLVYLQTILSEADIKQVQEYKKYVERVGQLGEKIEGPKLAVKAIHVSKDTGAVTPLNLFVGKKAGGSGYVMLDLTPGLNPSDFKLVYDGKDTDEVLDNFNSDNKYPEGEIKLELPANQMGLKPWTGYFKTTGASVWSALSGGLGIASLLLALGAIAAAPFTGGSSLIVTGLIIGSAVTGAAAGAFSIVDNLKNQETNKTRIAIDVVGIAGSMLGAGAAIRAARAGGNAVLLANSVTRYLLLANFGIAGASFILVSVEGVSQIIDVLDSGKPADVKTAAIARILANLIITGAMLVLAHKDLQAVNKRIDAVLGKTLGGLLGNEEKLLLSLLDDNTLGKLATADKEDMIKLARAIREDPSFLQRAGKNQSYLLEALQMTPKGKPLAELEKSLAAIRFQKAGLSPTRSTALVDILNNAGLKNIEINLLDDTMIGHLKKADNELEAAFGDWEKYKTRIAPANAEFTALAAVLPPDKIAKLRDSIAASHARQKILGGIPKKLTPPGATPVAEQREIVGGHSSKILTDPTVRVKSQTPNPDGTTSVTYDKLLNPGSPSPVYSKTRKNATLAPNSWSDQDIMDATLSIASQPSPFPARPSDNSTVHVGTHKGIEWEVIKEGGVITSSYPTGGTRRTTWP